MLCCCVFVHHVFRNRLSCFEDDATFYDDDDDNVVYLHIMYFEIDYLVSKMMQHFMLCLCYDDDGNLHYIICVLLICQHHFRI